MRDLLLSATSKLTAWFMLIIMTVSLAFSVAVYQFALGELSARFDVVQAEIELRPRLDLPPEFFDEVRASQYARASDSFINGLFYVNLIIFAVGGIGSYLLARRLLAPIEQANAAQSRFIADASHQLKTPLTIMRAEHEAAERSLPLSSNDTSELIGSTLEEVERLTVLSERLLELSQFDSRPAKTETKIFALDPLVEKSIRRLGRTSQRIELSTEKDLKINASQAEIENLIEILIDNALKYSPADSRVEVDLFKAGRQAKLTVSNSGSSISEDELERIFDRFYRSEKHATQPGYGLGLAIAKKIVKTAGGDMNVSSKLGKKTIFTVSLPLSSKS